MLDLAVLNAEIETGMYKKPIEVIAKEIPYEPLPSELPAVDHRGVAIGRIAAEGGSGADDPREHGLADFEAVIPCLHNDGAVNFEERLTNRITLFYIAEFH